MDGAPHDAHAHGELWRVERRLRYDRDHRVVAGLPQFGFHTRAGLFAVEYSACWVGKVAGGELVWTAGPRDPGLAASHVTAPFDRPRFVAADGRGGVLISDAHTIHRVHLPSLSVSVVLDTRSVGVEELGNAVVTSDGQIWLNDITGHQVLELTGDGHVVRRIGDGVAGFQPGAVPEGSARFGMIYDLRPGPGGRLYVLDSTNYAVRVIDPARRTVTTICGDGIAGREGDGGPARCARLGGAGDADFDGPWSLVVDATGAVLIGDTHNHAVRRIDGTTGVIRTIASSTSAAPAPEGARPHDRWQGSEPPLFTKICGMDLDAVSGRVLVPDWVDERTDELVVLTPPAAPPRVPETSGRHRRSFGAGMR